MTAATAVQLKHSDYKSGIKPIWCPGCGDFSVLTSLTMALAEMGLRCEDVVVVSGIGCSSRLPAYVNSYGFHGVHGRALPVAAGIKLARPELTVIAAGGDGDGYSIGGNHFLHACRRNVDMTYLVMDNQVYGMTKGQPSPTTEPDWESGMAPGGTGLRPFLPLVVALAAGANFIARGFSGDPHGTAELIVKAVEHPGFSFVEILSPCVTFRPEQREWRNMVRKASVEPTTDRGRAARRLVTDDGLNLGVLFYDTREPYQRPVTGSRREVGDFDAEFLA